MTASVDVAAHSRQAHVCTRAMQEESNRALTLEEREELYRQARARIFNESGMANDRMRGILGVL